MQIFYMLTEYYWSFKGKPFVFFQKISSTPQLPTYSLLQSLGPH